MSELTHRGAYQLLFDGIVQDVANTQYRVTAGANTEVVELFWRMGSYPNENNSYGTGYIDTLSQDLRVAFPTAKWAGARNLRYMAKFAREVDERFLHTPYAKLSWSHKYVGKLDFYLTAVDELLLGEFDNPTVGLLLCSEKNNVVVEWSLRDVEKPIGVSEYLLSDVLPSAGDLQMRIKELGVRDE